MQHTKQQIIKLIGSNGQISLGKENAGKIVSIEHVNENVWIIKTGQFIPEAQNWIYNDNGLERLKNAVEWNERNAPRDNFEEITKRLQNEHKD